MIKISVSTGALRALSLAAKRMRQAQVSLEDRRDLLTDIRTEIADIWAEDFLSEGRGEWDETSTWQQDRRVREGYSPTPTLLRSGATFSYFDASNRAGKINAASIRWTFRNADGAYIVSHHEGYPLGMNSVPARTLWRLEEEEAEIIHDAIEEWFYPKMENIF